MPDPIYINPLFYSLIEKVVNRSSNVIALALYQHRTVNTRLDYLNVDGVNKLTYLPSNKQVEGNPWTDPSRESSSIGRTIKRIIDITPTDSEIKEFAKLLEGVMKEDTYDISIVTGEEMRKYWAEDSYALPLNGSELWKSCMRYASKQDHLDFYVDNKNVSMMIATQKGLLHARALLWKTIEGFTVMDRIYSYSPSAKFALDTKAEVDYKLAEPRQTRQFTDKEGKSVIENFSVGIGTVEYPSYPYVDTFCYYDSDCEVLTNVAPDYGLVFQSTDGEAHDL